MNKVSETERTKNKEIAIRDQQIKELGLKLSETEQERNYYQASKVLLDVKIDSVSKALNLKNEEIRKIKGSTIKLTNTELISTANKLASEDGRDTIGVQLSISRPTTEYLVESAIEVKFCRQQLDLALGNIYFLEEKDRLNTKIFNTYEQDKNTYQETMRLQEEQLKISEEAFDRLKTKTKRRNRGKNVLIGLATGIALYGLTR